MLSFEKKIYLSLENLERIAIWKKFYTVLYSAFWLQRCWATYRVEQGIAYFKGGLFENKIVI